MLNKIFMLMLCSLTIASCATDYTSSKGFVYEESIESFVMTSAGKKLVIIGKNYHYIFDLDDKLQSILLSGKRKQITPSFRNFTVGRNNEVHGEYSLFLVSSDTNWLSHHDFVLSQTKQKEYVYKGTLRGHRYLAKEPLPEKYKFNKEYRVDVYVLDSIGTKSMKVLLTPVAIAADLTLAIVTVGGFFVLHEASLLTGNGGFAR